MRRQDHIRDDLWLRDHDHVGALDLGDRSPGALGHGTDGIGAHHFVAARDHCPGWQFLPGRGSPFASENGNAERGRWVVWAIKEVCSVGKSAAKTSWKSAGSIVNSTAVSAPFAVGYWSWPQGRVNDAVFAICLRYLPESRLRPGRRRRRRPAR